MSFIDPNLKVLNFSMIFVASKFLGLDRNLSSEGFLPLSTSFFDLRAISASAWDVSATVELPDFLSSNFLKKLMLINVTCKVTCDLITRSEKYFVNRLAHSWDSSESMFSINNSCFCWIIAHGWTPDISTFKTFFCKILSRISSLQLAKLSQASFTSASFFGFWKRDSSISTSWLLIILYLNLTKLSKRIERKCVNQSFSIEFSCCFQCTDISLIYAHTCVFFHRNRIFRDNCLIFSVV